MFSARSCRVCVCCDVVVESCVRCRFSRVSSVPRPQTECSLDVTCILFYTVVSCYGVYALGASQRVTVMPLWLRPRPGDTPMYALLANAAVLLLLAFAMPAVVCMFGIGRRTDMEVRAFAIACSTSACVCVCVRLFVCVHVCILVRNHSRCHVIAVFRVSCFFKTFFGFSLSFSPLNSSPLSFLPRTVRGDGLRQLLRPPEPCHHRGVRPPQRVRCHQAPAVRFHAPTEVAPAPGMAAPRRGG